jgi:hypothetical protein
VVVYQNGLAFVDAIKMLEANLLTLIWWGKRLAARLDISFNQPSTRKTKIYLD